MQYQAKMTHSQSSPPYNYGCVSRFDVGADTAPIQPTSKPANQSAS